MNLGSLRIGPPHASEADTLRDAIRDRQLVQAQRHGWPELDRKDLDFGPLRGMVTHRPTGRRFRLHAGEVDDLLYGSAVAYFVREDGSIGFLEEAR